MDDVILELKNALGQEKVLGSDELTQRYVHIWKMDEPYLANGLLIPQSTHDVEKAMKICHRHHQEIIVHGGLTNLVGATRVEKHQIVLSLEKMNNIEEIDPQSRTATVQSGVIVEHLMNAAAEHDLLFPMNFGAKGSAQIGGIISSNAGGLRVLKYGMTRSLVLGLEVVTADGTVISDMKKVVKDNSGYDLKQLFIGSEGTLGIVTKAVLRLVEAPKSRNSAWLGIDNFAKVIDVLKRLDIDVGSSLSGYELVWKDTFIAMTSGLNKSPLPYNYSYYVLVECLGGNQDLDRTHLEKLLEKLLEESTIEDACIAYTDLDMEWFWKIREDVHVLNSLCQFDQHFDISLPIPSIGDYVAEASEALLELPYVEKVFSFGHLADGNIHFIVGKTNSDTLATKQINEIVYSGIKKLNGSVSAEHGIGLDKKEYLALCQSPENIEMMKSIKKLFDPNNLLNPGRIINGA